MRKELKPCPFCGEDVYIEKKPLWVNHGGVILGYRGDYKYFIECPRCGCTLKGATADTVYQLDREAIEYIIRNWNTRYGEED